MFQVQLATGRLFVTIRHKFETAEAAHKWAYANATVGYAVRSVDGLVPVFDGVSIGRKRDRDEVAMAIRGLTETMGGKATCETISPREIRIRIKAPGGLSCCLHLNGDTANRDAFVQSWCMDYGVNLRLVPNAFGFDTVNPYHFRKATLVSYGVPSLLSDLAEVLDLCASGIAYQGECEVAA